MNQSYIPVFAESQGHARGAAAKEGDEGGGWPPCGRALRQGSRAADVVDRQGRRGGVGTSKFVYSYFYFSNLPTNFRVIAEAVFHAFVPLAVWNIVVRVVCCVP